MKPHALAPWFLMLATAVSLPAAAVELPGRATARAVRNTLRDRVVHAQRFGRAVDAGLRLRAGAANLRANLRTRLTGRGRVDGRTVTVGDMVRTDLRMQARTRATVRAAHAVAEAGREVTVARAELAGIRRSVHSATMSRNYAGQVLNDALEARAMVGRDPGAIARADRRVDAARHLVQSETGRLDALHLGAARAWTHLRNTRIEHRAAWARGEHAQSELVRAAGEMGTVRLGGTRAQRRTAELLLDRHDVQRASTR